jgi:peroxidase
MHQIITYNEYLPAMLGQTYTKRYNLDLASSGYFYGYDASVDASVANEFTTAAFRFGHSMIFDQLSRPSNDWTDEQSPLELKAFVFNPLEYVNQNGSQVEPVLRGLVVDPSLMADTTFPSSMKEFLFAEADKYGKDLLAINIQRGRDHGLRGYNDYREFFGLQRAADFDELLEIPADMRHTLSGLYEHVDDIDLYVGGLAETPVSGGTVGPTFAHMMAAQFRDLKVGDRFYFENGGCETTFTPEQLTELRKITLSSLICTCTDTVEIQKMPFYFATEDSESSPNRNANPRIPCSEIGNLDLSAWQQPYRNADELEGIPDSGVWTAWVPAYGNPPSLDLDVLHRERPTGVCLNAIGAEMRILETGDPQSEFF